MVQNAHHEHIGALGAEPLGVDPAHTHRGVGVKRGPRVLGDDGLALRTSQLQPRRQGGQMREHHVAQPSSFRSLGTSDRMLLHYFSSKENLIGQALAAGRPDVPALLEDSTHETLRQVASRQWQDLTGGGPNEPRLRLLLEVLALAMTQPDRYGSQAAASVTDWIQPLIDALRRNGFTQTEAQARATTLVSGLRGLALDFYTTGDSHRTTAAAELLIAVATEPQ